MPNAKTINWAALDREVLYSYFYSLGNEIVGKWLTADQIQKKISKHLKQFLPIKVTKVMDAGIKMGYVYIGGWYFSEHDKNGKQGICVEFSYHPFDDKIKLTRYRWKRMSLVFADVVLHEMVHMRQFRARKFKNIPGYQSTAASAKSRKEQSYYGDRDEMGAYAFNIACELLDRFDYDTGAIRRYLDSNQANRHKNSYWYKYLKTFDMNHDHNIIRRMKKKIFHQLENAYYGKPFKTTDWLTY